MGAPDPHGVWIECHDDGTISAFCEKWFHSNMRTRKARARSILHNMAKGWNCPTCGDPVPTYRRADAVYCSEGCRKRAARIRRVEFVSN